MRYESVTFGYMLAAASIVLVLGAPRAVAAEDETQACDPNGQLIAYGDVIAGCTIELVTDLDIFTFSGTAGDHARLILTRTAGAGLPCVELRAPDASVLIPNNCANQFLDIGPLPQSGIYQLFVSEQANNQTYTFNLSLERLLPVRSPTSLAFNQIISERAIEPIADIDTFLFNGNAGDSVRIILSITGGAGVPCFELRGPDDAVVVALACSNIDLTVGLAMTGPHQIVVTEQSNNQTVTYNVSLTCVSGVCPDPPPACIVDPEYAGTTLTLNYTVGTSAPATWHVALLAFSNVYTLFKVALPAVEPPASSALPIPGFPSFGEIGVLSTFTSASGLICTHLETVDTGPITTGITPELLRKSLQGPR